MITGALIGAYQEDGSGGLRALLPLSGRTLLEYQARCAAAAGAAPIILLVDEIPIALNQALERLQQEGIAVTAVSDSNDAANRFGAGDRVLLIGDGIAPPPELLMSVIEEEEPAIVTVADDDEHQHFERIDAVSRWSGVALADAQTLGATAAMLGDWDLQSTLLRRMLQSGARLIPIQPGAGEPVLAAAESDLAGLERQLIVASRGTRSDWASRYLLPLVEEWATEPLLKSTIAPQRLIEAALVLTLGAAVAFFEGWLWPALGLLLVSTPLDLIARRVAALRLQPLPARSRVPRLLWPGAGLALLALGWWLAGHGGGWGAFYAAFAGCAFAEAARIERVVPDVPGEIWLFSRRNAIFALVPFAIFGGWTAGVVLLSLYAGTSFFVVQFVNHSIRGS
jgi:hypothetical protein